jgi:hypothetical protein
MRRLTQLLFCGAIVAATLAGQVVTPNAVLAPVPYRTFLDANGIPLANGTVCTYRAGTLIPLSTYTDSTAGVANPACVPLDAGGRAKIWISVGPYKFSVFDSGGAQVWTEDNIVDAGFSFMKGLSSGGSGGSTSSTGPYYIATETGSNNAIAAALLDGNGFPVAQTAGLTVTIKLAHSLQEIGSNTFTLNGVTKSILGALWPGTGLVTPHAALSIVTLMYDGTYWRDMSQFWGAVIVNTIANRPATAVNGTLFYATDYAFMYVYGPYGWVLFNSTSTGPWQTIALTGGWLNASTYAPAHYRQTSAGEVFIEVFAYSGVCSPTGTTIFTIPAGYRRPDNMMYGFTYNNGTNHVGNLIVSSSGTGTIYCDASPGAVWIQVSISYWAI